MSVEIYLPPSLQYLIDNVKKMEVNGSTVKECLHNLIKQFPRLKAQLFDPQDNLLEGLSIYINNKNTDIKELTKPVSDGDKLYIINLIFGG